MTTVAAPYRLIFLACAKKLSSPSFKLIEFFNEDRVELYNLANDPSETSNLADVHPEVRDRLMAKLVEWKKEMKVRDRAQEARRAG